MNVICIDDDAHNRAVLREMLASTGLAMDEAPDATIGLKAISDGKYDLVFMDLRMPGLNGLTAIRQLRQGCKAHARPHVVVLTGDLSQGVKSLCQRAGADDFLEKPVDMAKLLDVVASRTSGQTASLIN